jgi:hypothetical protein
MKPALVLISSAVLLTTAIAANLTPIFDGRLNLTPNTTLTATEQRVFETQIVQAAKKHFPDDGTCNDDPLMLDTAKGAFTRPRAVQKALIYRYCSTGASFGRIGLAILENGALVRHDAFEEGVRYALGRMPDLNRDGVDELILATGGTQMGETWQSATVVELGTGKPRQLVQFDAYRDNCGSLEARKSVTAWLTFAAPGRTPRFSQQAFTGACESKLSALKASGAAKPLPAQAVNTLEWTRLK